MDAIERVEIAVRAQLAYSHAHKHGAFGYADDPSSLPKLNAVDHRDFMSRVRKEVKRSKEKFVSHFTDKYGSDHGDLPIWMVTETMTFGTILSFFSGASLFVKKSVASLFGMPPTVFDSWMLTLNAVRNICAHHARLWNRVHGVSPRIPRINQYPEWHNPAFSSERSFAILTICRHCVQCVAPQSSWDTRIRQLLASYSAIPIAEMGFPPNWEESLLWTKSS